MDDELGITVETLPMKSLAGDVFTFKICIPDFKNIQSYLVRSPEFVCFGRQWLLEFDPVGDEQSGDRMFGIYLEHVSEGTIKVDVDLGIKHMDFRRQTNCEFDCSFWGLKHWETRADIFEALENGALIIRVSVRLADSHFVPPNQISGAIRNALNDETTSDVLFIVVGEEATEEEIPSTQFHAHRLILKESAPILYALCEKKSAIKPVSIPNVSPIVFGYLLQYLYGNTIPSEQLEENAKEIIEISNKYAVTGLKIQAEACYVKSTSITMENVVENLHYSHDKDCALLNEAVMDFIVENRVEVLENISFDHISSNVASDLLAAVERTARASANNETERDDEGTNNYHSMRISTLRQMCHEKGLEVDGPRKALIDSLKKAQDSDE